MNYSSWPFYGSQQDFTLTYFLFKGKEFYRPLKKIFFSFLHNTCNKSLKTKHLVFLLYPPPFQWRRLKFKVGCAPTGHLQNLHTTWGDKTGKPTLRFPPLQTFIKLDFFLLIYHEYLSRLISIYLKQSLQQIYTIPRDAWTNHLFVHRQTPRLFLTLCQCKQCLRFTSVLFISVGLAPKSSLFIF